MEIEYLLPFLFPLLFGAFACAFFTSAVAGIKGHDDGPWMIGGFFFGPLALLAAVGLPDLKSRKYLRLLAEHQGAIEPEPISPSPPREKPPSLPRPGEEEQAQHRRIFGRVSPIPRPGIDQE